MKEEIKLQRDTCEKCLKGSQAIQNLKKEIFDIIYQWGRVGVVADENSPAIKKRLDDLEQTWY